MLLIQPYFEYKIFRLLFWHVALMFAYICPYTRSQTQSSPLPGGGGAGAVAVPGAEPGSGPRSCRPPKGTPEGTRDSCNPSFMGYGAGVLTADGSLTYCTCQGCCEKSSPLLLCCLLDNLSLGMDVAIPFVMCETNNRCIQRKSRRYAVTRKPHL